MPYSSTSNDGVMEDLRTKARFFLSRSGSLLSSNEKYPREVVGLVGIRKLLESLDLERLSSVPQIRLRRVANLLAQAQDALNFVSTGTPPKPPPPDRDWAETIDTVHDQIFADVSPILFHQLNRKLTALVAERVGSDKITASPALKPAARIWKYMPLRSFIRTVESGGIWMCSLRKLSEWTNRGAGISDTHEGELPVALGRLKEEYDIAKFGNLDTSTVVAKLPPVAQACADEVLGTRLDKDLLFVASWTQSDCEDVGMWNHYAEGGHGVALRTTVEKLLAGPWRLPLSPSGVVGDEMFLRAMLRPVRYLAWTSDLPSIESSDDLFPPFLKRKEFGSENEVRLLAVLNQSLLQGGFVFGTDLHTILEGIVVGPKISKSEIENMRQLIKEQQPRLLSLPFEQSTIC